MVLKEDSPSSDSRKRPCGDGYDDPERSKRHCVQDESKPSGQFCDENTAKPAAQLWTTSRLRPSQSLFVQVLTIN